MKERKRYQSYGEIAVRPDEVLFCPVPLEVMGKFSTAIQFAYMALIEAWNRLTQTDASRAEFRRLINELREKAGRGPITSLRTITYYFAVLRKLGVIERERKPGDVWETTCKMPMYQPLPSDLDKAAPKASAPAPTADPTKEPEPIDLEYGKWVVEFSEQRGWRLIADGNGGLGKVPIEGAETDELPRDFKIAVNRKKLHVLAYLKTLPPARE
jgi:hypothetical protein